MAQTTAQERAINATAARVKHARRRRFSRAADEIRAHSESLDQVAQHALAEALRDMGWDVYGPA